MHVQCHSILNRLRVIWSQDMEAIEKKKQVNFHKQINLKKVLKSNKHERVPLVQYRTTNLHWFGITGSHDMEANKKKNQDLSIK